jgi:hypothetical protein
MTTKRIHTYYEKSVVLRHATAALPPGKQSMFAPEYESGWAEQPVWHRHDQSLYRIVLHNRSIYINPLKSCGNYTYQLFLPINNSGILYLCFVFMIL